MGKFLDVLVCLLIVALDVVGGILGLKADDAQSQERHLKVWIFECKGPSHDAYVLGLAAASLLVIAHVIAILPCFSPKKASFSKNLSKLFFCLTWIVVAIGLVMLAIGILSNHKSKESCGVSRGHVLKHGGYVCMVHGFFAVAYYATATSLFSCGD
ncbi:hypothetical protein AAHA92_11277 [Salvia divinorum]|uniref:Uncharacterized protein n=1 Tax=Salvia divinorum TaxID=28513 RepID=A0ABD1HH01_SALDI